MNSKINIMINKFYVLFVVWYWSVLRAAKGACTTYRSAVKASHKFPLSRPFVGAPRKRERCQPQQQKMLFSFAHCETGQAHTHIYVSVQRHTIQLNTQSVGWVWVRRMLSHPFECSLCECVSVIVRCACVSVRVCGARNCVFIFILSFRRRQTIRTAIGDSVWCSMNGFANILGTFICIVLDLSVGFFSISFLLWRVRRRSAVSNG